MITLFGFGPGFGLPDPSPFVMKAELLLKMAKLTYQIDTAGFRKAPKGKLPYIDDDGEIVADSTLIRWHLEKKYGVDFDQGLSTEQRAVAWAFEKMLEDQLYWAILESRWNNDANFAKGPIKFFRAVPWPARPLVVSMVRRKIRHYLRAQGMGRHAPDEIDRLAIRSVDAIVEYLGDKSYFMGGEPTGVDATVFAFVTGLLCPLFESPARQAAERHSNLRRYVGRMMSRYYPQWSEMAGCKAAA